MPGGTGLGCCWGQARTTMPTTGPMKHLSAPSTPIKGRLGAPYSALDQAQGPAEPLAQPQEGSLEHQLGSSDQVNSRDPSGSLTLTELGQERTNDYGPMCGVSLWVESGGGYPLSHVEHVVPPASDALQRTSSYHPHFPGAEATRNKVSPPPAGEPSSPSPHYPGPPHRSVFRTQCFWPPWAELTAPALERSWQRLRKKTPFPVTPLSRRLSAAQSSARPQGPCSPQQPHGTVLPGMALSQGEDPATVCDQQPKMGTNLFSALRCHRTIQEVGALSAHPPPPAGSHRVSEELPALPSP
ncbi:uncharacterized protein LOC129393879 isoform X1 [Pan paniscus]|uniref:uncharacterized protein LOC129393879 isoform X1 n=1 Tax=Pan paniscus TaxID=9597 RepID=UPI00243737F5|nr:uncharacterized protein LOC129393879 isoform X1 [Pan paniscus]